MMDSAVNVILIWQPGSGIIRNKSLLLKSRMAHALCVKFLKVHRWVIALFDHLTTHKIAMRTGSFWTNQLLMICTFLVFVDWIGCTDIPMPKTAMELASVVVSAISHRSTLHHGDMSRIMIQ